jgi:DUF971 family protein
MLVSSIFHFDASTPCFQSPWEWWGPSKSKMELVIDSMKTDHRIKSMKPSDIQVIGDELAVRWENGGESFVKLEKLRRCCPCAGCKGEVDVMGHLYKNPDRPLSPQAFRLVRIQNVGGYAVQPVWGDGHQTGLYSYDYLQKVAEAE